MNSNSNSNGHYNNSPDETANLVEGSELGEVKTALGRLYKEVESFKQSQKTERERDRAELQAWAQTNLVQTQLLTKAMATIEILTNELKNQSLSSNEYEKNNADLIQQLTPLMMQLKNTPKSTATLESLEFKGLKSEITELKHGWKIIVAHIEKLNGTIQELKNAPPPKPITIEKEVYRSEPVAKYGTIGLFTAFFTLLIFFAFNQLIPVKISNDINTYLEGIWQRTGYNSTKLQRVERYLGTDPNQKRGGR